MTLLLNEGGTRSVAFGEIAELHLPRRDPWRAYQETLAVLDHRHEMAAAGQQA